MKKPSSTPLLIGLALILGANYFAYSKWYAAPIAEKQAELEQVEKRIRSLRNSTTAMMEKRRDTKPLVQRTLGSNAQSAEAALRSRLNSLFREAELPNTRVESRVEQRATINPASNVRLNAYRRPDSRGRLRSTPEPAFIVMTAKLRGDGPTERVLNALALLESQQWLQRLTAVTIEPVQSSEGKLASFSFEIQTLFIPDQSPESGPDLVGLEPSRQTLASSVAGRSIFTPPPPPEPVVRKPPKPEPKPVVNRPPDPPPPPPFAEWVVAFLRDGSSGPQLTIKHKRSGQTGVLGVGDTFHGMKFTGFDRLDALFEFEGTTYRIGVGQNLANRDNPEAVQ
ncbi:MAG: hypothetical protein ACIAQF_02465 [Phycisphaerales bacterium JB065]